MRIVIDSSAVTDFLDADGWEAYEAAHADVFEAYLRGWSNPSRRPAAVARMAETAARLRAEPIDWEGAVADAAARIGTRMPDVEVPAVVFVGFGSSNGWVTELRGRTTLFLAAEMAPPADLVPVLAVHEATHAVQQIVQADWVDDTFTLADSVFAEGLATYVSTLACPGLRDDEYLWFDGEHGPWLEACAAAYDAGSRELAGVLDSTDPDLERRFFLASPDPVGLPVRFGYYLGLRVVRTLAATRPLDQLLAWTKVEATAVLAEALGA